MTLQKLCEIEVLTAVSVKIAVFRDVTPCSWVDDRQFCKELAFGSLYFEFLSVLFNSALGIETI
jgi:hypothetical protein